MIKIGITGGIGSGKSVIATLLSITGVPVYVADTESKRLTATSPVIREKLTALFGKNIYNSDGLNKPLLASYIFQNENYRQQVNAIIHPEVGKDFQVWAQRQHTPWCALESAILFESGFDRTVDISLMVYAPLEMRIERALCRDHSSREDLMARIRSQEPDEIKKERADYVIYNDNRQAVIPQITRFLASVKEQFFSDSL